MTILLVFALSVSVFAADDDLLILDDQDFNTFGNLTAADYGVQSVSWAASFVMFFKGLQTQSNNFYLTDSSPSASFTPSLNVFTPSVTTSTVSIPAGTLTVSFSSVLSSASSSSSGASVSVSGSSLIVVSDGSTSPILLDITLPSKTVNVLPYTVSASFEPASVDPDNPLTPPSHTMQGMQNGKNIVLSQASTWTTYNQYIGVQDWIMEGKVTLSDGTVIDVSTVDSAIAADMYADISYNSYSWKLDESGNIVFSSGASASSWLDMIWKYLTYDYYWGSRLWSGDVSGSWYETISTSFSYLNYRVNQILQVLANDEDLKIKDATNSERQWVQDYFENGNDIADSGKYSSVNDDGKALKDFLTPAESASMSEGLSSIEDGGYDFWSESVYQDINQVSSTATLSDDEEIPYDQQINDLYSEHVASIWGAFYG